MQENKQKRTSWVFRVALLLLCLVLITTVLVSGMLARYVSSSDGNTGARVAYFDVVLSSTHDGNTRTISCQPNEYDGTKTQDFTVSISNGTSKPAEVTTAVDVYITLSTPLVRELEMTFGSFATVTESYNNTNQSIVYTKNANGSVTYCYKNAIVFAPGVSRSVNLNLRFYASTNAVQGVNGMNISVYAVGTQVD